MATSDPSVHMTQLFPNYQLQPLFFLTKDHLDLLPPYPLLWKKKSISKAREKHRDCQKERSRLLCGGALQSDGQEIFATGIVTAQKTFIVDW